MASISRELLEEIVALSAETDVLATWIGGEQAP